MSVTGSSLPSIMLLVAIAGSSLLQGSAAAGQQAAGACPAEAGTV